MQFAKDSFFMTLRARLAQVNPARTIALNGEAEPAVLVTENEAVTSAETLPNCFYVHFGGTGIVNGVPQDDAPLMALQTSVTYRTLGATDASADRGRALTSLDSDLLTICSPRHASKCDYTKDPAVDLGSRIFWSAPELDECVPRGAELSRAAKLTLYFYPEGQSA
jgi:hypothetical protein